MNGLHDLTAVRPWESDPTFDAHSRDVEAAALGARRIPFAPGYYVIDGGTILSARRLKWNKSMRRLAPAVNDLGYSRATLVIEAVAVQFLVHRIVAAVFNCAPPFVDAVARHIDGNTGNNFASNIAWGTQLENIHDKWRHGTMATGDRNGHRTKPESTNRGSLVGNSKLTEAQVGEIRSRLNAGETGSSLSREFGVTKTAISSIRRGITWSHVEVDASLSKSDRCLIHLEAFGERLGLAEWARRVGIGEATIRERLKRGWPVERALSERVKRNYRKPDIARVLREHGMGGGE